MITLDELTNLVNEKGATDLFLREEDTPKMRLLGRVEEISKKKLPREILLQLYAACDVEVEASLDVDGSYRSSRGERFRVNLYRHMGRLSAALRPIKNKIPSLSELGLPDKLLMNWIQRDSGLILITGATGSGKSTTVASCLEWVNQHKKRHIVTIEDPVEYLFKKKKSFFSQREVATDTASFNTGLKYALRQSPDIIFLGEVRDAETAMVMLQAAETGHLVFTTLHSPNVIDSFDRLTNLFPPKEKGSGLLLLASQLIGVLSQKLLPGISADLYLVTEHLQNEGATRNWIREMEYNQLTDFMRREDNPNNIHFMRSLVKAYREKKISKEVGMFASEDQSDFDRFLRGVT